jgi:hypothetical protein
LIKSLRDKRDRLKAFPNTRRFLVSHPGGGYSLRIQLTAKKREIDL